MLPMPTPTPMQPPSPAWWWRIAITIGCAGTWTGWFLVINHGQPFRLTPTDNDLNTMRDWFDWWGIYWIKFIPFIGDILMCIIVGAVAFPWGLNLTLAAIVLPLLSLMRPYRDWDLTLRVAIWDFGYLRLIYILIVLCFYTRAVIPGFSEAPAWCFVPLGAVYGLGAVVVLGFYIAFIKRSISMYDPFP